MRTSLKVGTVAALAFAVACGDSTGPGSLDQAQKTALDNALTASGALAASPVAAFASFVVNSLQEAGHMSGASSAQLSSDIESSINASVAGTDYDAVGLVIDFTVPAGGQSYTGAASFVFGWSGLSTSTNTVSEFVSAGIVDLGTTTAPTGTRSIPGVSETQVATATWYENATSSQYAATSGSITMTPGSFSGSTACPGSDQVQTVTCTFSTGTISGNFAFESALINQGSGAATYSQPQINFSSLPAIKVSLTVTQ